MADSRRQVILKELDAAIGNLEWAETHLSRILGMYLEVVNQLTENNQEIPNSYAEIGTAIDNSLEAITMIKSMVQQVKDRS